MSLNQFNDSMRTDKTGSAGNKNSHNEYRVILVIVYYSLIMVS